MENFGSYLKTHREKKSIRLEEIASITKIHLHSLELLETSQWEQLPPEPFIRGFIIAYAKYIGLDSKEVIERYCDETGRNKQVSEPILPPTGAKETPTRPNTTTNPVSTPNDLISSATGFQASTKIVAGVAAAIIFTIVAILISVGKHADAPTTDTVQVTATTPNTATEGTSSPSDALAKVTVPATAEKKDDRNVAAASAPKETPKPIENPAHEVIVEGKERTWVKVVIDENQPLEFFLSQGEKATYSAKTKIKVVLGNSTGAKVTHNGKSTDGTKFMGTIRSFKFPNNAKFPQDNVTKRETGAAEEAPSAKSAEAAESTEITSPE